jgi:hypothetical protein
MRELIVGEAHARCELGGHEYRLDMSRVDLRVRRGDAIALHAATAARRESQALCEHVETRSQWPIITARGCDCVGLVFKAGRELRRMLWVKEIFEPRVGAGSARREFATALCITR